MPNLEEAIRERAYHLWIADGACCAVRTMAVGRVQCCGRRGYKGPDWSRSDHLVEYGTDLPFGGLRSWTRPRHEPCQLRADFRTPLRPRKIRRSELASATNKDRDDQYRAGQDSPDKHVP